MPDLRSSAKFNGIPWKSAVSNLVTVTAGTTTLTALNDVVLCNPTSGAITLNLPAASTVSGKEITFKQFGTVGSAITITPNGSDTIEGAASYVLPYMTGAFVTIVSDGVSKWYAIAYSDPAPQTAQCTSALTLSTTETDITGATLTVAVARNNATVVINGVFDVTLATAPAFAGYLNWNGSDQTPTAVFQGTSIRGTVAQNWSIPGVSIGYYTAKLRGKLTTAGTGTSTVNTGNTSIVSTVY